MALTFLERLFGFSLPVPDAWQKLESGLGGKLANAQVVNVQAIAARTDTAESRVEEVSGYPTLWLEFGDMIQAEQKPSLGEFLALGWRILKTAGHEAEIWQWYKAYLVSVHGWGEIHPRDYMYIRDEGEWNESGHRAWVRNMGLIAFDKAVGIVANLLQYRKELCRPSDIFWLNHLDYPLKDRVESTALHEIFRSQLRGKLLACSTEEELDAFINEIPFCPMNGYFYCGCDVRDAARFELGKLIESRIASTRTAREVEAIRIPRSLHGRENEGDLTGSLASKKARCLRVLRTKEEEEKIRAELAQ